MGLQQSTICLHAQRTSDGTEPMLRNGADSGSPQETPGGCGAEAGGFIKFGGSLSAADVTITDANGRTVYSATGLSASTNVDSNALGVELPLTITTANMAGIGTLDAYWYVKR